MLCFLKLLKRESSNLPNAMIKSIFLSLCVLLLSCTAKPENIIPPLSFQESQDLQPLAIKPADSAVTDSKEQEVIDTLSKKFAKELLAMRDKHTKSCNNGNGDSCVKLALTYQLNHLKTQDSINMLYIKARKIYEKGCERGVMSDCSGLGALYESGDGVQHNKQKGRLLYKKACDGHDPRGCLNLGLEIKSCIHCQVDKQRLKHAILYFQKACEYGSKSGCYMQKQSQQELDSEHEIPQNLKQY